jgi:hypothetical protein
VSPSENPRAICFIRKIFDKLYNEDILTSSSPGWWERPSARNDARPQVPTGVVAYYAAQATGKAIPIRTLGITV